MCVTTDAVERRQRTAASRTVPSRPSAAASASSIRFCEMSPDSTARIIASIAAHCSSWVELHSRTASQPALIAATVASGNAVSALTAFMPRSSLITTPRKPRALLRTSVTTRDENDATRSRSMAGTITCAVMMAATSASIARAERHELDGVEPSPVVFDHGQRFVRVHARVAVSGKVLAARRDAEALQRAHDRRAKPPDDVWIVSTSARSPITGFCGFECDVEHRRVVQVDADGSAVRSRATGRTARPANPSPLRPSVAAGGQSVKGARRRATRPPS